MPRTSRAPRVPTLTHHKPSGRARCRWKRRDHYFGPWGTAEADAAFRKFVAAIMQGEEPDAPAARRVASRRSTADGPPVSELIGRFKEHLERTRRLPDGTLPQRVDNIRLGLRRWRRAFGGLPVAEFGPAKLAELRDGMVREGLALATIKGYVAAVRQCVRWGVSRELVDAAVLTRLEALEPLRKGQSGAKEPPPVKPAADADVTAALPHMPAPVAAMVRLQRRTAARPGEVCRMTPGEIDRTGAVWFYRPRRHKNAHRGKVRNIPLGPRSRELLGPVLETHAAAGRGDADPLFQPRDATAAMLAARRTARVTPESCGNTPGSNRRANPKRVPGTVYSVDTYRQAIHRACDAAGVPRWSPNRLRHTAATEVRQRFGLSAARDALGHAGGSVTEVYAEASADVAARVAAEIG